MTGTFAYSFDRETFYGRFPTREAALAAAGRALKDRADQPEGIFVGQWAEPDPQTDGHAETVLAAMHDRFAAATGDTSYLNDVSEQQAAALDTVIQTAIRDWLTQQNLTPRATTVRAVSHHPVPNVHHVEVPAGRAGNVDDRRSVKRDAEENKDAVTEVADHTAGAIAARGLIRDFRRGVWRIAGRAPLFRTQWTAPAADRLKTRETWIAPGRDVKLIRPAYGDPDAPHATRR